MALTELQIQGESARREKQFNEYLLSEEYQTRLKERLKLNDAGNRYLKARAYLWNLCERTDNTAEGIKFFINNFCYTFNPKTKQKHLPFFTFEFQDSTIQWVVDHIEGKKDGLLEKSREMGITWLLFAAIPLYYWLFRDGVNFLVGSYKEVLVDDKTSDSIFGKIDYLLAGLPKWMIPKKFNINKHRTKLKLINPSNNNLISGDTMNPQFGRGARKTAVLFDELGFWDYAKDAWESTSDTTECRIANSTPHGYNYYAHLRESGIDVLTLLWNLHPMKDQQWYEFEKHRRTEEEFAQEIEISYSKSREGKVYPEWNDINVTKGIFKYDEDLQLYVGMDFGKSDDTAIIWAQKDSRSGKLKIIDTYRNTGKNIDFYIPFMTGIVSSDGYRYTKDELEIIGEHKEWRRGIYFGDPAGRFVNAVSDETVISVLRNYGIIINFKDRWKAFSPRKSAAKRLIMDGVDLNSNPRVDYFNICMINSAYPKVKQEGMDVIRSEKPKHDAYCLAGDTKIRTLDGWHNIEDLVDKDFYVWSYSITEKRLIPTKAGRCWKSGIDKTVIEVGLDNGKSITCTPDHRFMLRNGDYREAKDLQKGDSLMPFYERNNGGYPQIMLNDGSFAQEHKYVYSRLVGDIELSNHIDHIDGVKSNNNPSNLQSLTSNEHCSKTFLGKSMKERRQMSVNIKPYITEYSADKLYRDCLSCGQEIWVEFKQYYCNNKCSITGYRQRNSNKERINRNLPSSTKESITKYSREFEERNKSKCIKCNTKCSRRATYCIKCKGNGKNPINHKVRFIKKVIDKVDVYDIEVPGTHNFVAEGVVLHNSHFRSAFEYLALGMEDIQPQNRQVRDRFPKRDVSNVNKKNKIISY